MKNRILKNMEWPILICVIILTVIGCLELFSVGGQSEYAEFKKQILWFAISIPITVLIITIDYNIISKISPFLYVIMILKISKFNFQKLICVIRRKTSCQLRQLVLFY